MFCNHPNGKCQLITKNAGLVFCLLTLLFTGAAHAESSQSSPATKPNIIFIVVDDIRFDEFGAAGHAYLQTPNIDRLAANGVMFTRAYHAVPLCSPSRASILTGQYPSTHGIIDNVARNLASHQLKTFPRSLQQAGYDTAFVGKWHMGNDPTPRPGFDHWVSIPGQGRTINPELYENGKIHTVTGYITDVLTDRVVSFIEQKRDRPFFVYLGHKAMHPDSHQLDDGSLDLSFPRANIPAPRHRGRYEKNVFPRRPNAKVTSDSLLGKPAIRRALARKESSEMAEQFGAVLDHKTCEETIRRRAEMLLAVDESLGRIVETLEKEKKLANTLIVFTSDNGYFYGEHGLSLERRLPYEESIRNALLLQYPARIKPGTLCNDIVITVDLAPTALEAAGVPIGNHIQGRSLLPLIAGRAKNWRRFGYIEFYAFENPFPWLVDMDYRAVVSDQFKYIHWIQHPQENELYDLSNDPYEQHNLIKDKESKPVVDTMRSELQRLQTEALGLN